MTLGRRQEALNLSRAVQADDGLLLAEEFALDGEAMSIATMGLRRIEQDRLAAEEGTDKGLAVAGAPKGLPS